MNKLILLLTLIIGFSGIVFSQNHLESPYAIFGDRTPVRDVEHTPMDKPWQIFVLLPDSTVAKMELCGENLVLTDYEENIIAKFKISNTTKAIFAGADPKASKMPSASPYSYCFGNPIIFVDPTGEEPTPYQSSLMCRAVYKDETIPKGQTKSDYEDAITLLDKEKWILCQEFDGVVKQNHNANTGIGMQSMIFKRTVGEKTEYAFAFAGTNSWEDCVTDITQVYGLIPDVGMALDGVSQLKSIIGSAELTDVAHSLGSVLASAASMATGDKAITFNPAVISPATKFFYGLKGEGKITNYISSTPKFLGVQLTLDPVTLLQNAVGLFAPGKSVAVPISNLKGHSINVISDALK